MGKVYAFDVGTSTVTAPLALWVLYTDVLFVTVRNVLFREFTEGLP
jgi:hypothetical protein